MIYLHFMIPSDSVNHIGQNCWGIDAEGSVFEAVFLEPSNKTQNCLLGLATGPAFYNGPLFSLEQMAHLALSHRYNQQKLVLAYKANHHKNCSENFINVDLSPCVNYFRSW